MLRRYRILHRCSTWISQEIDRLAALTDKAIERHGLVKEAAKSAAAQHIVAQDSVKTAADDSKNKKASNLSLLRDKKESRLFKLNSVRETANENRKLLFRQ